MNSLEALGLEALVTRRLNELIADADRKIKAAPDGSEVSNLYRGRKDAYSIVESNIATWIDQAMKYSRAR